MRNSKKILSGIMAMMILGVGSMGLVSCGEKENSNETSSSKTDVDENSVSKTDADENSASKTDVEESEESEDFSWDLTDGVLTISGQGDMPNYDTFHGRPWDSGKIENIIINDGITSIGDFAFYECKDLTSVTIPDSVTSIGSGAFCNCRDFTITFPESITSIACNAFLGTAWLDNRKKENPLVIINHIMFDGKHCSGDLIIPDDVVIIGDYAFEDADLTSVTIPNGVTSIGAYAFYECDDLKSVTIPDGVTSIGELAFGLCYALTEVVIPDSVTSIDSGVFSGCRSLKSITIPENVTSIGDDAFAWCDDLTEITILNSECEVQKSNYPINDAVTIHGYEGSTAQKYAEDNGYNFEAL